MSNLSQSTPSSPPHTGLHRQSGVLILVSIASQTIAATLLKHGALQAMPSDQDTDTLYALIWLWLNPYFVLGLMCLGIQTIAWMLVLKKTPLSQAYPFMSLVIPSNLLMAYLYFNEVILPQHLIGMLLIMSGIIFIARGDTHHTQEVP